jgi:protein ImuB
LASDQALRHRPFDGPFALSLQVGNAQHVYCVSEAGAAQGVRRGMALADARAICPDLMTRSADLVREAAGLVALRRFAGRYAPLVAIEGRDGLLADVTGVGHLFGDEAGLRADLHAALARAGITAQSAIAGSRGAAHALARHGGGLVPEGRLAEAVGPLPVAALRIEEAVAAALGRVGLCRIADIMGLPRAPLARRFGPELVLRLDQILGAQPEPVAASAEPPHFGVRMSLPEPIGLQADVMAGLERLLARLCASLAAQAMGARRLLLELHRVDGEVARVEIGLAQPMRDAGRIAALFARGVAEVDAGFGIEVLRLSAPVVEALAPVQVEAGAAGRAAVQDGMADLITRLGNRLGFEAIQRLLPAESLIPERSFIIAAAAYAEAEPVPPSRLPRPITIFAPEPVSGVSGHPPARFRWRRMGFTTLRATGPERIAPEWWFDDPAWRSGLRDYWRVETREGPRLWLFHTPQSPGWSVQGEFA